MRGGSPTPSASSKSSWRPAPSKAAYSDLLRFEERLLQNAAALQSARRRYQAVLLALGIAMAALGRAAYAMGDQLQRYVLVGLFLICATTVVLFFATGVYGERITRAYKFVPQANRSLRPFNLYLNTGRSWFGRPWKPTERRKPTSPSSTPLRRSSSRHGQRPEPIPPPSTARGELVFSPRVDSSFQAGYDRYRADWRRRKGV